MTIRLIASRRFKKGHEKEGQRLLEQLLAKSPQAGFAHAELLHDEADPQYWVVTGTWNSIEARNQWVRAHTDEFAAIDRQCKDKPILILLPVHSSWGQMADRRVA